MQKLNPKQKALLVAELASQKKAEDIVVLDMRKLKHAFCDFFVICSAPSTRRVKAISEEIEEEFDKIGIHLSHVEGRNESLWVLLDYVDIVVHIFLSDLRSFYNLEHLWFQAPRLKI